MKSAIFPILFFFALSGSAQATSDIQSSIPSGILNDQQLHTSILSAFDAGNYAEAARLLETMNVRYPEKYATLPYALLHAHSLALSEKITQAQKIYKSMLFEEHLSRYAPTPLARISAIQGNPAEAIQY
jgi:outer membrane protein assembly factor BamD (BamD/ComL family)